MINIETTIDWALQNNYNFLPLKFKDKLPCIPEWKSLQFRKITQEEITMYFRNGTERNVGFICGNISNGVFVIDFDNIPLFDLFKEQFGEPTRIAKTGKGYHAYFKSNQPIRKQSLDIFDKNNQFFGHIDIQGEGSYVVMPPSIHPSGAAYTWINDKPVQVMNVDDLQLKSFLQQMIMKGGLHLGDKQSSPTAFLDGANEGGRNVAGIKYASYLRSIGLDATATMVEMIKWNSHNVPPLQETELLSITRSAFSTQKPYGFKEVKEKIDEQKFSALDNKELSEVAFDVMKFLYDDERNKATELVTQYFEKHNKIYTIRNDNVVEMWVYKEGIFVPDGQTSIKELCRNILDNDYTSTFANAVIAKVEVDTYINEVDFFREENLDEVCIANGILNLKTKQLSEFIPDKKFLNKIPATFDANATCPNIDAFFDSVFKNKEDKQVVWEIIGNCLLRDYRFGKAIMCCGNGSNGKSVFLNLLKHFLGFENCVNIPLQEFENNNFALGSLHCKLANLGGELSNVSLKTTGAFKKLTGQDIISADRKFLTRLHFGNYCKQLFSTNELPVTYDLTPAFFRRWLILEFPFKFFSQKEIDKIPETERNDYKVADTNIIANLTTHTELSGLLNKALEGLARLIQQSDFSYSKSINEVKELWICKADNFLAFCLSAIEQDNEGLILKEDLRRRYNEFCIKNKVTPRNDKHMFTILTQNFGAYSWREQKTDFDNVSGIRTNTQIYSWKGIRFKSSTLQ